MEFLNDTTMDYCKICNYPYKKGNAKSIAQHIKNNHKDYNVQSYYDKFIKKEGEEICQHPDCNNMNKFLSIQKGYTKYCSQTCGAQCSRELMKKTCEDRYGYSNVFQSDAARQKNYAVKSEKKNKRLLDEQNEYIQTVLERLKTLDKTDKSQCQICGLKHESVISCGRHIDRYHNMTVQDYYDQFFKKDEFDGYCHFVDCCNKDKYEKTSFISMEEGYRLYHCGCQQKAISEITTISVRETKRKQLIETIYNRCKQKEVTILNMDDIKDQFGISATNLRLKLNCNLCNTFYETRWECLNHKQERFGRCPSCFPKYANFSSDSEEEVHQYIKSIYSGEIKRNYMGAIRNPETNMCFELDIYIPERSLAIEYDGLYWHSEKEKDKEYHYLKTKLCNQKGIRLIHIFEDEWVHKREIVKSKLASILGRHTIKINARDCVINVIESSEKDLFLEENHLQGKDISSIRLGAFFENTLISVMTFAKGNISKGGKTEEGVYELNRFCVKSGYHIPGIFSKILSYFKNNYEWKEIYSYADLRWSAGNVYTKMGFNFVHQTVPQYWYVDTGSIQRYHRYGFRKRTDEPEDVPEYILREKEGYIRIWDCGLLKYNMLNESIRHDEVLKNREQDKNFLDVGYGI